MRVALNGELNEALRDLSNCLQDAIAEVNPEAVRRVWNYVDRPYVEAGLVEFVKLSAEMLREKFATKEES